MFIQESKFIIKNFFNEDYKKLELKFVKLYNDELLRFYNKIYKKYNIQGPETDNYKYNEKFKSEILFGSENIQNKYLQIAKQWFGPSSKCNKLFSHIEKIVLNPSKINDFYGNI